MVTKDIADLLRTQLQSAKDNGHRFLFQMPSKTAREDCKTKIRDALRAVDPNLELRSIRRGALQHMASQNVSMEDLRIYSRHSSVAMLRRYLHWGRAPSEEASRGMKAAGALWNGF